MVTSDRIVVMNKGRIEQIDAPYALYARPRTRFVAGFIGRTNFIEGQSDGVSVGFGAFSVHKDALASEGALPDRVLVSLRPQNIRLLKHEQAIAEGHCRARGRVHRRAYLGEYWDYHVALEGVAEPLRVTTRAQDVFEAGDIVFVDVEVAHLTVVS
jgi:iron(III) transport system ATP-binding protein